MDNIFILIHTLQSEMPLGQHESLPNAIAKVVSRVAPSMLLSTCSQTIAFLLGNMLKVLLCKDLLNDGLNIYFVS